MQIYGMNAKDFYGLHLIQDLSASIDTLLRECFFDVGAA